MKYPEYERFKRSLLRRNLIEILRNIYMIVRKLHYWEAVLMNHIWKKCLRYPLFRKETGFIECTLNEKLIALQLLLEINCQFLCEPNGLVGKWYIDLLEITWNEALRCRFYNIKLMAQCILHKMQWQTICLNWFYPKCQNNAGYKLQILYLMLLQKTMRVLSIDRD